MKISVRVKTRSRQTRVQADGPNAFKVWVAAVPEKGRANEAVLEALAGHLKLPKSSLRVISGHTSPRKIIEAPS